MTEGLHSPAIHARERPDAAAVVLARTGEQVTWRELDERSNQTAHLLRALGLHVGDTVALLIENHVRAFEIAWAVLRTGLRYTFVNTMLTGDEAAEILEASGARVLVTSTRRLDAAVAASRTVAAVAHRFVITSHGEDAPASMPDGWRSFEEAIASMPATPVTDEREGAPLWFSSGTSGRPKGVVREIPDTPAGTADEQSLAYASKYGFGASTVHLALGPLHHAAPIGFSTMVQRFGGTVVLTEHFDAETVLGDIERYGVTFSHFVPTMFVRFLKLPADVRGQYEVDSLEHVLHGAAPCPPDVKRQMIEWWGPILDEYYAGTEGVGATSISSTEWLAHPGSVGRASRGTIHITDEDGNDVAVGVEGMVWFDSAVKAVYRGDPAQTAAITHPEGWQTLGDVGYVDDEGFLFLTDRWTHKIVSGGVNVFPREVEDVLVAHPKVLDVAVIGVPDDEMGESVRAVVEPVSWNDVSDALGEELVAWTRARLAHYKSPRGVDFERELPRGENGKLYKRLLRDRYWAGRASRIL
jgi:fatty-acyl-CoA synthase